MVGKAVRLGVGIALALPGAASAATYHAAPVAADTGDCTARSPCTADEAVETAISTNSGPDTVRLAAGTYAEPIVIDTFPRTTSDPITVVGEGTTATVLAAPTAGEGIVVVGTDADETAPADITLQNLGITVPVDAGPSTNGVVSRTRRLALDGVRMRIRRTGPTGGRSFVTTRRTDAQIEILRSVLDPGDDETSNADTGPGVFTYGPLLVRDSMIKVDRFDSAAFVVPINARGNVVIQRSTIEGGTTSMALTQDTSVPVSALLDSTEVRGSAVGIVVTAGPGFSLALRNSEIFPAFSFNQRISIGSTSASSGPWDLTIDSSVFVNPMSVSGVGLLTCTHSYVAPDETRCPDPTAIKATGGSRIDLGNPAALSPQESTTDRAGNPRVVGCGGATPRRDIGPREAACPVVTPTPAPTPTPTSTPEPTPTPTPTPTATPGPSGASGGGSTGQPTPTPTALRAPRLLSLALAADRFRASKGTRAWFTLDRDARVTVVVADARKRTRAALRLRGRAGGNDLALKLKAAKLRRGPITLTFTPVADDGMRGTAKTLKAVIR